MMVINIECVTDVDKQREIIIFDSILTSYKPSIDFLFVFFGGAAWEILKIGLSLLTNCRNNIN